MKTINRVFITFLQRVCRQAVSDWELTYGHKKWQVTYIAPLNHLPLLPSGPGGVQQELAV